MRELEPKTCRGVGVGLAKIWLRWKPPHAPISAVWAWNPVLPSASPGWWTSSKWLGWVGGRSNVDQGPQNGWPGTPRGPHPPSPHLTPPFSNPPRHGGLEGSLMDMLGWPKWVGERFVGFVNQLLVVTCGGGVGKSWLLTNHGNSFSPHSKAMGLTIRMC